MISWCTSWTITQGLVRTKFAKKYLLVDQSEYEILKSTGGSSAQIGLFTHPNVKNTKREEVKIREIIQEDFLFGFRLSTATFSSASAVFGQLQRSFAIQLSQGFVGKE